jgi:hypothetical protein
MRRFVHGLLGLVLLVVLVAGALWLVSVGYSDACWNQCLERMQAERGWAPLLGVSLLAVIVFYLLTFGRRPAGPDQYLAFSHNGATVSIQLRAVTDFIARIADEFAAIVSMKPHVEPRGRSIVVSLDLRVKAGTQIPELSQLLQERVRESLQQHIGISSVKRIAVNVREIVGDAPAEDDVTDATV